MDQYETEGIFKEKVIQKVFSFDSSDDLVIFIIFSNQWSVSYCD